MKASYPLILILLLAVSLTLHAQPAEKPTQAIQTMAKVLMSLNHFPSATEKELLRKIRSNSNTTPAEADIAQALINLQHSASRHDKTKLLDIINDKSQSVHARTLARIIRDLNHKPSAEDKLELSSLD